MQTRMRTLIAANWKMHKNVAETRAFFDAFLPLVAGLPTQVEIAVAPPFTALSAAAQCCSDEPRIALAAQNMHWSAQGAYTGEISLSMLADFGVGYVIVGHSERREYFDETDHTVNLKVQAALGHGVTPIIAVGETLAERDAGITLDRVVSQTQHALQDIDAEQASRVVFAYEPIWAIGSGRSCDPLEADAVMGAIRDAVDGLQAIPILYGGSVKAENIAAYMGQPNIGGGLVGGASLDPHAFAALIRNAAL